MFCVLDWGGGSRGATSANAMAVVLRKNHIDFLGAFMSMETWDRPRQLSVVQWF